MSEQEFLNPYNFIPVMPRDPADPLFGDAVPNGHHRLHPEHFSGTFKVCMTAATPLLVPEAEFEVDKNQHSTRRTRRDSGGRPLIPSTTVKGMLRVAFESISNSRYGIVGNQLKEKVERRQFKIENNRKTFPKYKDEKSPHDVIPRSLRPATKMSELSPADRVFGWVSEQGSSESVSSWAGQLSIGPISYKDSDLGSGQPVTLSVLAGPKVQQTWFYAAQSASPNQVPPPTKAMKYGDGLIPRGRKVYPHQQKWDVGHAREHRRKGGEPLKDEQNQTFKDWIPAGSSFEFLVTIRNMSAHDLGGLYFLLSLEPDRFHRFGGGKPLGFGSVTLTVTELRVSKGEEWKRALHTLNDPDPLRLEELKKMSDKFIGETKSRTWGSAVLSAFEATTRGFGEYKTYYPRRSGDPASYPDGMYKNFEWFMDNKRPENSQRLPMLEVGSAPKLRHPKQSRGGGHNRGRRPQ